MWGERAAAQRAGGSLRLIQLVDALLQLVHFAAQALVLGSRLGLAVPDGFHLLAQDFPAGQLCLQFFLFAPRRLDLFLQFFHLGLTGLVARLLFQQALLFLLQAGALGIDGVARHLAPLFLLAELPGNFFPTLQGLALVLPGLVGAFDLPGARQDARQLVSLGLALLGALLQRLQTILGGIHLASVHIHVLFLFRQESGYLAHGFQRFFLGLALPAQAVQVGLQGFQALLTRFFLSQLGVNFLQTPIQAGDLRLHLPAALKCPLAVCLPNFQPEDAAQDALAVTRPLLGELIGFALQEERGIDESLIIQAQGLLNAQFRFA